jgi:hypothetical protein
MTIILQQSDGIFNIEVRATEEEEKMGAIGLS